MLGDTLKRGCQTKWKYVILLLSLCCLTLGTELLLEHGQIFRYYGRDLSMEGDWIPMEISCPHNGVAVGDVLYLKSSQGIFAVEQKNARLLWQETEMQLVPGEKALGYSPRGKSLCIFDPQGVQEVSVSGGVDALIPGDMAFAVITTGSGAMTRTKIYDYNGTVLGRVDETDVAMLQGVCTGDRLVGLCYGTDGLWRLKCYDLTGVCQGEYPLEAQCCDGILSVGDGLVVLSEDALTFWNDNFEQTGTFLLGSNSVCFWSEGDNLLAVVLWGQGGYRLVTFSPEGELLGEAELPMEIRALEVSGSQVCLLDFECLRVYDAFGHCDAVSSHGARASCLVSDGKGLWLLGDGEAMYFTS